MFGTWCTTITSDYITVLIIYDRITLPFLLSRQFSHLAFCMSHFSSHSDSSRFEQNRKSNNFFCKTWNLRIPVTQVSRFISQLFSQCSVRIHLCSLQNLGYREGVEFIRWTKPMLWNGRQVKDSFDHNSIVESLRRFLLKGDDFICSWSLLYSFMLWSPLILI